MLLLLLFLVAKSCLTLCNPMDYSSPGSSVYGISQTRILEWVAISFSRGIFLTQKSKTPWVSFIGSWILYHWATREACIYTHIRIYMHMIYNHYININIHTYNINRLAKKFIQVYSILWKNSNFLANPINTHLLIYMHWFCCFSRELWPMQGAFWEG